MNIPNIYEYFLPLQENEMIMKEYYEASYDPEKMALFLKKDNLDKYGCFIPGVCDAAWEVFTENNMFPGGGNIQVAQHLRYTPHFTHSHTMFEILYVFQGKCENIVKKTKQQLSTGDYCIIAPNTPHTIGVFDESIIFNILIKKSTFNETFFKLLAGNNLLSDFFTRILYTKKSGDFILFHTKSDAELASLTNNLICESLNKDDYTNLCMENILMLIFSKLLRDHCDNVEIPSSYYRCHDNLITDIIKCIECNYKTITLAELANKYNYTAPYVSRLITEVTGKSFSEILSDIKHNKALTLLSSTDMTVSEISEKLGYESNAYFHRKFKQIMNMTPLEYRKKNL